MGRDGATLALKTKGAGHPGRALPFQPAARRAAEPVPAAHRAESGSSPTSTAGASTRSGSGTGRIPLGLPDALFLFGSVFLVFDHYTDTISLVGLNYREKEIDIERALDETERRINDLDFNFMAPARTDWKVERAPAGGRS